jgi:putative phosphoribosyl transferase
VSAMPSFRDRQEAGHLLGERYRQHSSFQRDALVLGLVRGGAVVAQSLAAAAGLGWDILIVRKIGAPHQPEYAVGAFCEPDCVLYNTEALRSLRLDAEWQQAAAAAARRQCAALQVELRGGAGLPELAGRQVVLTDDGIATGLSMFAAIAAVRQQAAGLLVAAPVIAPEARQRMEQDGLQVLCLAAPAGFRAVGQYYNDFSAVSSSQVSTLLAARTPASI